MEDADSPDFGMTDEQIAAVMHSVLLTGKFHGYPDGMTEEELLAKVDAFNDRVVSARLTLATVRGVANGAMEIWVDETNLENPLTYYAPEYAREQATR